MYPWEYARNRSAASPNPVEQAALTPEEMVQLTKLRTRYQNHPQYVEYGLDGRRLAFARWLVERGWLHEDL